METPSTDWSVTEQGVLVTAVGSGIACWLCCFSGPGVEMEARPTCYLRGGEVTLRGEVFLFASVAPPGTGAFGPCDVLYLAVNGVPSVFRYLSQFPCSTSQGMFLAPPCHVPPSPQTDHEVNCGSLSSSHCIEPPFCKAS